MPQNEKIDYVEFPAKDISATKTFFSNTFGWTFVDYGETYIATSDAGLNAGFFLSELHSTTLNGGALIVLYSDDLIKTEQKINDNGGMIVKDTFDFPGGKRFHFCDPNGNEFAVWTDK
jgi:uncharacterized protein